MTAADDERRDAMRFPGEVEALRELVAIGHKWGFGNCIEALEQVWADVLESDGRKYGVNKDARTYMLERRVAAGIVAKKALRPARGRRRK